MATLWRSICSLGASLPPAASSLLRLPWAGSRVPAAAAAVCRRPLHLLSPCTSFGSTAPVPRPLPGTSLCSGQASLLPWRPSLLVPACGPSLLVPARGYKVKSALKLRCSGCYFVRRQGRLFVECKLKPRHKQMQVMAARKLFRDDYSKGNVVRALHWKHRTERFYRLGNNHFARHNWLEGKLGHTV